MLTFQLEPWGTFWPDAQGLWLEHYAEVGAPGLEMDVDAKFYQALEFSGQLQIITARDSGELQGYVLMLVRKHPHYRVLCGFEDAYFLTRKARRGRAGIKLLESAVSAAKARGVAKVFFHSKLSNDLSKLFSFLGFTHSDELWSKVI